MTTGRSVEPRWKQPRTQRKGRARPDEPLAVECQARLDGCTGRAEVRHHVVPRSAGGGDRDTVDICDADHRFIHAHPAWSYEHGWLKRRPPLPYKNPRAV